MEEGNCPVETRPEFGPTFSTYPPFFPSPFLSSFAFFFDRDQSGNESFSIDRESQQVQRVREINLLIINCFVLQILLPIILNLYDPR